MQKKMENHLCVHDMKYRALTALLVGGLFLLIATNLNSLVTKYVPSEYYYKVDSMTVLEKNSKPCLLVNFAIDRTSKVTQKAFLHRKLILLSPREKVSEKNVEIVIDKGRQIRQGNFTIPCGAPKGFYVFENLLEFEIDGVKKTMVYKSNVFEVR